MQHVCTFVRVHGHVKLVSVRVPDEHVPRVRDVYPVGEGRHGLAADAAEEVAVLVDHNHAVALERWNKQIKYQVPIKNNRTFLKKIFRK